MFTQKMLDLLTGGIGETLYMTLLSTLVAYLLGLPIGVLLCATDKDGICPNRWVNGVIGFLVNILRSVPFIILFITIMPFTRWLIGTTYGPSAVVVALVVCAAPFVGRMVESSLKEVDAGVIEAARAMGASNFQLIWKVLLPEARPSLLVGSAIAVTTIFGYSTMAGFVGGGGLGTIAINYGYYRYNTDVMMVTVVLMIVIVQVFQIAGMKIARLADKRIK